MLGSTNALKYAQPLLSPRSNTDTAILQKLGDGVPEVKRSDIEQRGYSGSHGGGRGRRGYRGGFASRGFAAAGLVRGGAPRTNGDA